MSGRIPVLVCAGDPISQTGIATQLRARPEIRLVENDSGQADVGVVVSDEVDDETVTTIKSLRRRGCGGVVSIVTQVDDAGLFAAIEAGAAAILRRSEASIDSLLYAVRSAAAGDGTVPPDLLGRLLDQIGRLQRQVLEPRGLSFRGLTQREIEVLQLVAEGLSTGEIARRLAYSERTIKNVIHDVTTRLHLRNRSHAVAYAMREGLI
jgi:DNA-binding NarL/FixJ family response regulator